MDNLGLVISGQQIGLALYPVKKADIDGVQVGVMNDGSPFLTLRGLARLSAVDALRIVEAVKKTELPKPH